ncbi:MAG: hypothetical protein ACXVD1_03385 [Nocardioides sp.]
MLFSPAIVRIVRRISAWIPVLGLVAGTVMLIPGADAAHRARITITPSRAAPGEPLVIRGKLPTAFRRTIFVQRGMFGSFGDLVRTHTDKHGRFRVTIPKNGMPSDPYRVRAPQVRKHHRTYPAIITAARTIVTLRPNVSAALSADAVAVGAPVELTAVGTPVRPGRPLTLQRRISPTRWQTVASHREDARGSATFALDTSTAGIFTYRVRAETWHGSGWMPTFPVDLSVGAGPLPQAQGPGPAPTGAPHSTGPQPGPVNAANTFKWGRIIEDWGWEKGESTDPWQIYADGSGRASIDTALLVLDSGVAKPRQRDTGSVRATLTGAGHAYGRWEAKVRGPIFQSGSADYRMGFSLVPARPGDQHCGGLSVDVGSWTGYGSTTTIGVRHGNTAWTTTRSQARNEENWHTLAVEVTPTRIVWFIDARVTAVLKNSAAIPRVPLVPQLRLDGAGAGVEMNHARLNTDWLRYFTLAQKDKGRIAGPAPTATAVTGAC